MDPSIQGDEGPDRAGLPTTLGASARGSPGWCRAGGAAGIGFVVVFIVGLVLQGEPPVVDDPVADIRRDWIADGQQYLVASYLLGLAFVFLFIPFVAALLTLLGRAEGDVAIWSRVCMFGAIATILWGAWSGMFWAALAYGDFAESASDETLRTLTVLDFTAVSGATLAYAVFIGGASIVIARTGVLWRWVAYLGGLAVALSVVAPLTILTTTTDGPLAGIELAAFLLFPLWVLLVGIAMLRQRPVAGLAVHDA
jgi:hypothetical protein